MLELTQKARDQIVKNERWNIWILRSESGLLNAKNLVMLDTWHPDFIIYYYSPLPLVTPSWTISR